MSEKKFNHNLDGYTNNYGEEKIFNLDDYYIESFSNESSEIRDIVNDAEADAEKSINHLPLFNHLYDKKPKEVTEGLLDEVIGSRREKLEHMYKILMDESAKNIAADTETKLELASARIEMKGRAKELEAFYKELGSLMFEYVDYLKNNPLQQESDGSEDRENK